MLKVVVTGRVLVSILFLSRKNAQSSSSPIGINHFEGVLMQKRTHDMTKPTSEKCCDYFDTKNQDYLILHEETHYSKYRLTF